MGAKQQPVKCGLYEKLYNAKASSLSSFIRGDGRRGCFSLSRKNNLSIYSDNIYYKVLTSSFLCELSSFSPEF